jgi:pSer/pThr/pTyr-binding forkhead associated (FHA) protein
MAVILVIDYLRGARKGQREIIDSLERVSFGRHPENRVVFDAMADIDASSRHAELARTEDGFLFRDIGSSNGTFVGGEKVDEMRVAPGQVVEVEFGSGGPILRLWIGEDVAEAPPITSGKSGWKRFLPWGQ